MRIIFFTKGRRSGGSSRHRAFNWADKLNEAGHDAKVIMPPIYQSGSRLGNKLKYIRVVFSLRKDDVVILQTTIFNRLFIVFIYIAKKIFKPRIIFDFDDAIYIANPIATKLLARLADKVIVASHVLAKWRELRGKQILVMPNLINLELASKYTKQSFSPEKAVLGWGGGALESLPNLKLLVPVFKQLIANGAKFKFKLIGTLGNKDVENVFSSIGGLEIELIDKLDWAKTGEIQKTYATFDIGLNPLLDNEDNRARCSLKLLDYMSVGLPTVSSPVGENNNFIENGVSGFLSKSTDEWVEVLKKLINDTELRKTVGQKAQKTIEEKYSYKAKLNAYVDFIYDRHSGPGYPMASGKNESRS